MKNPLLLIFVKNPIKGKVKTRLAASIGDDKALEAYKILLQKTFDITSGLEISKKVCYTWTIDENDLWSEGDYIKEIQEGDALGQRMFNAFKKGFSEGHDGIVIIGSDCYELEADIINDAFESLKDNDVVLGPAVDGGYYLLGMNLLHEKLFLNKSWSTESVFIDTIEDIIELGLKHKNLTTLSDIDNIKDLVRLKLEV